VDVNPLVRNPQNHVAYEAGGEIQAAGLNPEVDATIELALDFRCGVDGRALF